MFSCILKTVKELDNFKNIENQNEIELIYVDNKKRKNEQKLLNNETVVQSLEHPFVP